MKFTVRDGSHCNGWIEFVCSCFFNLSGAVIAKCVIIDRSFFQHLNTQDASAISDRCRTVARTKSTSVPRDDRVDHKGGRQSVSNRCMPLKGITEVYLDPATRCLLRSHRPEVYGPSFSCRDLA